MNAYFKKVRAFIREYRSRKGGYVFVANILVKFNALLLSFAIVRIISEKEYGALSYAQSVIVPLTAFIGLGANHALLRFGAIQNTFLKKWSVFKYAQKVGFYGSLALVLGVMALSSLLTNKLPEAQIFLILLSLQLLFNHWNLTQKSLFRILRLNNLYGYSGIFQSIVLLVLSIALALAFQGIGYVLAMVLAPLISFIYYLKYFRHFPDANRVDSLVEKPSFWKYGLFVGIGAIASQMLFNVGIIMLGNMVADSEAVAVYKVASLIPFNLLFIPTSFLKGDYVYLTENARSKDVLIGYAKKYWGIMSLVSIPIFMVFFVFSKPVTILLFGSKYLDAHIILRILIAGTIGAMMFRSLFGSMLLAVGKANWNVINAFFILILNIVLGFFLIKSFGAIGAAYALSISLWIGAMGSGFMLLLYLKRYTK